MRRTLPERQIELGIKGENIFQKWLNKEGIPSKYVDKATHDFEALGRNIEVKSTQISIKARGKGYSIGEFIFEQEQREQIIKDKKGIIAFILRHQNEGIIIGILESKHLPNKRKISLHAIKKLPLKTKQEFLKKYNK